MSQVPAPPVTDEAKLKELRERRRMRRLIRAVERGLWRDVLLRLKTTQHLYPVVEKHSGQLGELLVKFNLIKFAFRVISEILALKPAMVTAPEGYDAQQQAVKAVKERCLFDARLLEAARCVVAEGEAALAARLDPDAGAVLALEDNEVCFPAGEPGPDGQPRRWERRWVIEIPDPADPRRKINVLRVEHHWKPMGRLAPAAVSQQAFVVETAEPLAFTGDAKNVRPIALDRVLPPGLVPPEFVWLPSDELDIVQLVASLRDNRPEPLMSEQDLDGLDAFTAAVSRVVRVSELHGDPRFRVPESAIDKATGEVKAKFRAFADPDKQFEQIIAEFQIEQLMALMDKFAQYLLTVVLRTSTAFMGLRVGQGATPDTYDKMRLESASMLASARSIAAYMTPALQRAWTVVCRLESSLPEGGFEVEPVSVRMTVELPKDFLDIVREQGEALAAGLTSQEAAVKEVHGAERGQVVWEQIQAEGAAKADLAAKSLMSDFGKGSGTGHQALGGETGQNGNDAAKVAA